MIFISLKPFEELLAADTEKELKNDVTRKNKHKHEDTFLIRGFKAEFNKKLG